MAKGQILVELINATAAWKHRACLTERAATVTMLTEHSLPKHKRSKLLSYLRKEGQVAKCGPTVPASGKDDLWGSFIDNDRNQKGDRGYPKDGSLQTSSPERESRHLCGEPNER